MSLVEDLWNGYVLQESAKVQQRLGVTQTQQQDWQNVPVSADPQARAAQAQQQPPSSFSNRTLLIVGGLAAGGLVLFLALR